MSMALIVFGGMLWCLGIAWLVAVIWDMPSPQEGGDDVP